MARSDGLPPVGEALRYLLAQGSIARENDPEFFQVISRNRARIIDILAQTAGFRLITGTDAFYVQQAAADVDQALVPEWLTRGGAARGLALFLYCMWFASNASEETSVLSEMADGVREEARETGVDFDWTKVADRRLLQYAVEYMEELDYVEFREGSAEGWAAEQENLLLAWRHNVWPTHAPLSDNSSLLLDPSAALPPAQRFVQQVSAKMRLYRWLLCHPMFLSFEDPEAFELLMIPRHEKEVRATLEEFFALSLERDDTFARTRAIVGERHADRALPFDVKSSATQIAFLLAAALRAETMQLHAADRLVSDGCVRVTLSSLDLLLLRLRDEHADHWKAEFRTGPITRVTRAVLREMLKLGIARIPNEPTFDDEIVITSAAAVFAPYYVEEEMEDDQVTA